MIVDSLLKEFGTDIQNGYVDAVNQYDGYRTAARALGVSDGTIRAAIKALRKRAATQGYSPEHDLTTTIAPGYTGRGHSSLYKVDQETGERTLALQWVKTRADDQARQEALDAATAALAAELPRLAPQAAPAPVSSPLCNLFTLTDAHVGMLAWHKEGGSDWDLKIAEDTLVAAFLHMVAAAPRARVAVVGQLGDLLHQDSLGAVTPTSGHLLDADGRFRKIIAVAIRVLRRVIDAALLTHDTVHVIMAEGNHDPAASAWLQAMFAALYENEPRLTVNDSALPFYVFQHGKTMIGFHHGHTKKNDTLPLLFATQYAQVWGNTEFRYAHTGHRHHSEEKEHSGMKVIQHSTLAARDAYAARGGWHTMRQAIAITYHEEFGEIARNTVTPGMLQ